VAACGAFEGLVDDDPPAVVDGASPADAGAEAGGDDARPSDGDSAAPDAGGDGSTCKVGVGALDPAYGARPVPYSLPRSLVTPAGVVHSVVRTDCPVDGGTKGLSLHTLDVGGSAGLQGCFGTAEGDVPRAVSLSGGTMYVTTTRPTGLLRGRVYGVDLATGAATLLDEHAVAAKSVSPAFVVPGPSGAVWGGLEANVGGDTGFLKLTGRAAVTTGAEIPLGAAVRGADLYVVLHQPSPAGVVARRYTIGGTTLVEQTAFAAGGRSRVAVSGTAGFGAVDSALVLDGDDLWFVAPVDGATQGLYSIRKGAEIKLEKSFTGFIPGYLAQTCDRSIVTAALVPGGEVELSRHGGTWPAAPRVQAISVHGFGVDGAGRVYVTVGRGAGAFVVRVNP
jgi:hypothetical protein